MAVTSLIGQESFSKISLSGFTVNLTQSNQFSIKLDTTIEVKRIIENDTLYIGVIDQTGPVPKSTMSINVDKLSYLELQNSKLVMESPITVDTLNVELGCSFGTLKVNAKTLSITAGAATQFTIEGKAEHLTCDVGGASNLFGSNFIANQGDLAAAGYSRLFVNAKEVTSLECDGNSYVTNLSK